MNETVKLRPSKCANFIHWWHKIKVDEVKDEILTELQFN